MFGEHLEGACSASEGLCGPRPQLPAASLHLPGARQPLPGPGPISARSASSPRLHALHVLEPADPLSLQGRALSCAEKPTMPPLLTHNSIPTCRDNQGPAAPALPSSPQAAEEGLCSPTRPPPPSVTASSHALTPVSPGSPALGVSTAPGVPFSVLPPNLHSPRMSSPLPQSSRSGALKEGTVFAAPSLFPPGNHSPK